MTYPFQISPPGFDRKYKIEEFAELRTSNVTDAVSMVVKWAQSTGGGRIIIPGGDWYCDPTTISGTAKGLVGIQVNAPIWIEGCGDALTVLRSRPDAGQAAFRWTGGDYNFNSPHAYGGLRNLLLYSLAENDTLGDGVVFENTLMCGARDVWVRGFDRGIVSLNCQNQVFRDVHGQCNHTSWFINGANQVRLESCYANQDYHVGFHMIGGQAAWSGGVLQGGFDFGILLEPPAGTGNAIRLACRDLYVERSSAGSGPSIMGRPTGNVSGSSFAGTVRFVDANFNVTADQVLSKFDGYQVIVENWGQGNNSTWCEFRHCQVYGRAMPGGSRHYLADAETLALSAGCWQGMSQLEAF